MEDDAVVALMEHLRAPSSDAIVGERGAASPVASVGHGTAGPLSIAVKKLDQIGPKLSYVLVVNEAKGSHEVTKDYADVSRLQAKLYGRYDGRTQIPLIPKRSRDRAARTDAAAAAKLHTLLQRYFDRLMEDPILRGSEEVQSFVAGCSTSVADVWQVQCKQRCVLDVVLVEARHLAHYVQVPTIFTSARTYPSLFEIRVGRQRSETRLWEHRDEVLLNHDASFMFESSKVEHLIVTQWSTGGGGLLGSNRVLLGVCCIPLDAASGGEIADGWWPLLCPSKPGRIVGRVYLLLQSSQGIADGFLSHKGVPTKLLPLRLCAGDVLLFNSTRLLPHVAKMVTMSPWDHVGIVIQKHNRGRLMLLEATSDGVTIVALDAAIRAYFTHCREIGVRRLKANRTADLRTTLYDWARSMRGKPYNYNFAQMLRLTTGSNGGKEKHSYDRVFCSELVAAAFLVIGVLPSNVAPSTFLPSTFARDDVAMAPGFDLEPLLRFNKPAREADTKAYTGLVSLSRSLRERHKLKHRRRETQPDLTSPRTAMAELSHNE